MFNPLLAAALGFVAGMTFLALVLYLFWRLGAGRGPTVESVRPAFESIRPTVESVRPVETLDGELIAVLAAAASETLQAPLRVLSHRVETKR